MRCRLIRLILSTVLGVLVFSPHVSVIPGACEAAPGRAMAAAANPALPQDNTPCGKTGPESLPVPPDFEITLTSEPLHDAVTTITAKASGRVAEKEQNRPVRSGMRPGENVTTYTISQGEVARLYARVVACRFFDLRERYANERIMDGGLQYLKVISGGKSHAVTTYSYHVERFNRIAELFQEICRPAKEASRKEKGTRPRMIAEEEAEEIVWNLPEVRAIAKRMKGTNANPFTMITGYPDPEAKPGDPAAAYEVYVGENHGTHTVHAMTFRVDAYGGKVSVYDDVADRVIPIEQYRKQVRK